LNIRRSAFPRLGEGHDALPRRGINLNVAAQDDASSPVESGAGGPGVI